MKYILLTILAYTAIAVNFSWIAIKCLFLWRNPRKEIDIFIEDLIND